MLPAILLLVEDDIQCIVIDLGGNPKVGYFLNISFLSYAHCIFSLIA